MSTFDTPASFAASSAAALQPCPATRTCTSPPIFAAALTAFAVPPFSCLLSCSATTRATMSDHFRFILQLFDELRHILHHHARLALAGLGDLDRLQARSHVHAERVGLHHLERL